MNHFIQTWLYFEIVINRFDARAIYKIEFFVRRMGVVE